ncbi:hypothetical protein GSI_14903 [Ganoderma sinense ZZ0214-1]|uniref:Transporter n=1 Tax=Ganoderma sinense ZZ0214-1 TaxID=1077348 RepID=A0A2G8RPZ9_9APHY|nr:hypothetical protein GSI_14903 [Ganoderma sinense ZZ0214-1]
MQFSTNFSPLALFTLALASVATAMPFDATTDANLTYVGAPINPLAQRQSTTMVTYCTKRVGGVCGGSCSVYNGGPTCIDASGTSCLSATNNVGFCDRARCGGSCHDLSTCGTHLDKNFCATPGTQSILVSE